MNSSRNNQQLLIIALELFESILAEIERMRLFTMNHEHGTANLIAVSENRHRHKGHRRGRVPACIGIDRTHMIAALRLVIII